MSTYVVAVCNLFDNDLILEKIEAEDHKHAITKHSIFKMSDVQSQQEIDAWLDDMPNDDEEIKDFFFNADHLVGWIKL